MVNRGNIFAVIVVVTGFALLRAFIPIMQHTKLLWLGAISVFGPWIVWHFAKQLYSAAIHGYVLAGIPERRLRREANPNLYRNNVIANIVLFPIVTSGIVIMLLDALQANHLIQ